MSTKSGLWYRRNLPDLPDFPETVSAATPPSTSSDPTFHARWGSGRRQLNELPQIKTFKHVARKSRTAESVRAGRLEAILRKSSGFARPAAWNQS